MTTVRGYVADIAGAVPDRVTLDLYLLYEQDPTGEAPTMPGKVIVLPFAEVPIASDGFFSAEVPRNDETIPPSSLYKAEFRAGSRRTVKTINFVADRDVIDLADPSIRVVTPVPPGWAPIKGEPGEPGEPGTDVLYDTLPQTSPVSPVSGRRTWIKPGMGVFLDSTVRVQDLIVNATYYEPFELYDTMRFDAMACLVATARAGGFLSMSLYAADGGWQPLARVLPGEESGLHSTGVATLLMDEFDLTLPKGRYLAAGRSDINVGLRYFYGVSGSWGVRFDAGNFHITQSRYRMSTFTPLNAWPDPGEPWTDEIQQGSWGNLHRFFLRPAV